LITCRAPGARNWFAGLPHKLFINSNLHLEWHRLVGKLYKGRSSAEQMPLVRWPFSIVQ
jgi:hypothetical protein